MRTLGTTEEAWSFIHGEYDDEAMAWLMDNIVPSQQGLDLRHVLHCLKGMTAHIFHLYPVGDFGRAVLKNDLREAVGRADETNLLCLNLYTLFLHWKISGLMLSQARKDLK